MRSVPTRHGSIAYSTRGNGPPLYLLPANGHAAADFDAVRPELSNGFETIALDWPSMGASAPGSAPHRASATSFAEILEDVDAGLKRAPGIFIGHSVGGFAAVRLAIESPARVRGLVLVDAGGFVPIRGVSRAFCRLKGTALATRLGEGAFARFHTRKRNEHVAAMLERIDRSRRDPAYAATVAAVWRSFSEPAHDLSRRASAIRCPTLVIWGARDPVLPLNPVGCAAMRLIRNAECAVLQTGHSPFVEDPRAFVGHVLPFLRRLAAAESLAPRAAAGP